MNTIPFYQVDTFTNDLFKGNPAGVCPLSDWLPDEKMQAIAMENNLSETAFYVKEGDDFYIRWFTPTVEVDLCGHATLATAFVEFFILGNTNNELRFTSKSGNLFVMKKGDQLELDFPKDNLEEIELTESLITPFQTKPIAAFKGKSDVLLLFGSSSEIENMTPDLHAIKTIDTRGVIVTAKGDDVDFVSRFFAPQAGIDEDPVTGSAHTTLTPFWSPKLVKNNLSAKQLSQRGGELACELVGDRVKIAGAARLYLKGEICL